MVCRTMRSERTRIPDLSPIARDALVNAAMENLICAAKELGVNVYELKCMLELGMTPIEVVDYLEAKLNNRIQ